MIASPEHLLQTAIAPQAAQLDRDPKALHQAFQTLGNHNLLGLKVKKEAGGQAWSSQAGYQFTEQLARDSGALAFLQSQHQRCVQELAASNNLRLQQLYLKAAIQGQVGLGVGFSHLRRVQQPVTATATTDGYVFNGTVPWLTGFGIFQHWLLAAQLPDGRAVFVLAPFYAIEGALSFSPPMSLAAMGSTQTVTVTLNRWVAPHDLVLDIKPAGWIHSVDATYPLTHNFFALGCAQAGLDILSQAQTSMFPAIAETYSLLNAELDRCRAETYAAAPSVQRLQLRAWAIDLAVRCAHGAVIVSRGAANYDHHPAQRVYREALAFSVSGQNNAVMNASLAHIRRQTPAAKRLIKSH